MGRGPGRQGRPWRRLAARVLNESDLCHWCGHGGANAVDHLIPLSLAPELAMTRANLEPIHGVQRCPTCHRACNSEKGNNPNRKPPTHGSRDW